MEGNPNDLAREAHGRVSYRSAYLDGGPRTEPENLVQDGFRAPLLRRPRQVAVREHVNYK